MQAESPSSPQDSADNDDEELRRVLAASEAFDDDLLALLRAGWNTSSRRSTICLAFCRSAIEHAIAQRVLIEAGLTGTALSLIRLQFEAVVRAAWVLHAAKEDWLDKFSAPVPDGELSEPQMGPPIPAMIEAIGAVAGPAATELKRLHGTVKVMHSFVHGGVHLVVHALRGYPAGKLTSVLQNRNLLSLMLANVIVIVSQDPGLRGSVGRLSGLHAACMPPLQR